MSHQAPQTQPQEPIATCQGWTQREPQALQEEVTQ